MQQLPRAAVLVQRSRFSKGDNFVMPDGTLAVNTWKLVGGIWYYFNAEGNRTRGWFLYGGKWYYLMEMEV